MKSVLLANHRCQGRFGDGFFYHNGSNNVCLKLLNFNFDFVNELIYFVPAIPAAASIHYYSYQVKSCMRLWTEIIMIAIACILRGEHPTPPSNNSEACGTN